MRDPHHTGYARKKREVNHGPEAKGQAPNYQTPRLEPRPIGRAIKECRPHSHEKPFETGEPAGQGLKLGLKNPCPIDQTHRHRTRQKQPKTFRPTEIDDRWE